MRLPRVLQNETLCRLERRRRESSVSRSGEPYVKTPQEPGTWYRSGCVVWSMYFSVGSTDSA